jgi:hypothetical protein
MHTESPGLLLLTGMRIICIIGIMKGSIAISPPPHWGPHGAIITSSSASSTSRVKLRRGTRKQ